jgi:predicted amidophosphoribosyltransferase
VGARRHRQDGAYKQLAGPRFRERAIVAEDELGPALTVTDPAAVAGRRVLVYEKVFTCGVTLREVALKLGAAGAVGVSGLVLARRPHVAR